MRSVRLAPEVVLPAVAILGAAFQGPGFGGGFTLADVAIIAMVFAWIPKLQKGEPRGLLAAVSFPLILILLGSLLGALTVGIEVWIVRDLAKDLGAFASFLAMVTLLRAGGPRAQRAVGVLAAVSTIMVVALLLSESGLRARGGFPNPNVAAHFLGTNLIVLAKSPVPTWLRVVAVISCVGGLAATGSFGALLMVAGAFTYLGYTSLALGRWSTLRWVVPLALVAASLVVVTNLPETTEETGFNTQHLERSSGGRMVRWEATLDVAADNLTGIGPGSNRGLGLLPHQQEAHNEYLAYLTERGIVGLAGLLLLFTAIWRFGSPGGLTRALIVGFALQGLVRETTHYRHLWFLLALGLVLDEYARRRDVIAVGSSVVEGGQ